MLYAIFTALGSLRRVVLSSTMITVLYIICSCRKALNPNILVSSHIGGATFRMAVLKTEQKPAFNAYYVLEFFLFFFFLTPVRPL